MTKKIFGLNEGDPGRRDLLGGKGASLVNMQKLNLKVPSFFIISTAMAVEYENNGKQWPIGLKEEVDKNLLDLETYLQRSLGDVLNPLTVSVRSGAPFSMPGMMDTILNVGLNDETVKGLADVTNNPRFAYDCYRRLISMYGISAFSIPDETFEQALKKIKEIEQVKVDSEISVEGLKTVVDQYKEIITAAGFTFPQDVMEQLYGSITAVFESWNNEEAIEYRENESISHDLGTAVPVQTMVFGNKGDNCGSCVLMSRNTLTGERMIEGDALTNAQGEDVVNGSRLTMKLSKDFPRDGISLEETLPGVYEEIVRITGILEREAKDIVDIEITFQDDEVYVLQYRVAKRSGKAAFRAVIEMVEEGLITKSEAILRITKDDFSKVLHKELNPKKTDVPVGKGEAASPGGCSSQVVLSAEKAELLKSENKDMSILLVTEHTSPQDIKGMNASDGILTATGGTASHAAVVCKQKGKTCVVGASEIHFNDDNTGFTINGHFVKELDWVSIDGNTGDIYIGQMETKDPEITEHVKTFMDWCYELAEGANMFVRANAEDISEILLALSYRAVGVGLIRQEHMFFDDRLDIFQDLIVHIKNTDRRKEKSALLLPLLTESFKGIFTALNGLPGTVRLLDPPAHEFLPSDKSLEKRNLPAEEIALIKKSRTMLHESNPMMGNRGCRLLIVYPDLAEMLVRCIFEGAAAAVKEGVSVQPEIMVPLITSREEFIKLKKIIHSVARKVMSEQETSFEYTVGTMIETPAAVVISDELGTIADFFSYGTNDLTQYTTGVSRDDVGTFLPTYLKEGIWKKNPFVTLLKTVGSLVTGSAQNGRAVKPMLKLGICGEHGGDPESIKTFYSAGLNYVSCSAPHVPIAYLGIAQAATLDKDNTRAALLAEQYELMEVES